MTKREITRLDLVSGGTVIRQGHYFTLEFSPRSADGQIVDLTGKDIQVSIVNKRSIVYQTEATYDTAEKVIHFDVTGNIGNGQMWIELTATDPLDDTFRMKFPSSEHEGRITFIRSTDDVLSVGVSGKTVEEFETARNNFQNQIQEQFNAAVGAVTDDSEVVLARGTESLLGVRLDKDKQELIAQLEEMKGLLDSRIDDIITEPATGITQQEIIDARQSEISLGANLRSIKKTLSVVDNDVKQNANELSRIITEKPIPEKLTFSDVSSGWSELLHLSKDGKVLFFRKGKVVEQSLDEGKTIVAIGSPHATAGIQAVRDLDNGELLITTGYTSTGDIKSKIFKTVGYDRANPQNTTFVEVFQALTSNTSFSNNYGLEVHGNICLASEIGGFGESGSRRVYLSVDNATTFKQVFDIRTVVVEGKPVLTNGSQINSAHYDSFSNRIWISTGDVANSAVYYSDDLGDNWKIVKQVNAVQFKGIVSYPEGVMFGTDSETNGIYAWKRTPLKTDNVVIFPQKLINTQGVKTHTFQRPFKRETSEKELTVFPAQRASSQNGISGSLILGFTGLNNVHVLYELPNKNVSGFYTVVGDTFQGNIVAGYYDGSIHRIIKAKTPVWNSLIDDILTVLDKVPDTSVPIEKKEKPYPQKLTFTEKLNGWSELNSMSDDGQVLYFRRGKTLEQSLDEGDTLTVVGTSFAEGIQAVRELSDGELLVSTGYNLETNAKSKIFKSVGYNRKTPQNTTFRMVMESLVTEANIYNSWGLETHDNICVASEYGKWGVTGARYVYLSTDFGNTWKPVFDLITQVVEGRPPLAQNTSHIHTVHYDRYFNRIWVAVGDRPNSATYYSDDLGVNWKIVNSDGGVQFTGIGSYPEGVIFGSDSEPNGVYVWKRTKEKTDLVNIEPLKIINNELGITHIFQRPYRRYAEKNELMVFSATRVPEHDGTYASLIMGFTGIDNPHILYELPNKNVSGFPIVLGKTSKGNIVASYFDVTHRMIKAKAPVWE